MFLSVEHENAEADMRAMAQMDGFMFLIRLEFRKMMYYYAKLQKNAQTAKIFEHYKMNGCVGVGTSGF